MAVRMPMIATTIISSIREKPFCKVSIRRTPARSYTLRRSFTHAYLLPMEEIIERGRRAAVRRRDFPHGDCIARLKVGFGLGGETLFLHPSMLPERERRR